MTKREIMSKVKFTRLFPNAFYLDADDLDLFAGLTLGWYVHNYKWAGVGVAPGNYGGNAIGGFQLAGQIGARYELDDWTLMAQLNGGLLLSGFLVGLSFPL